MDLNADLLRNFWRCRQSSNLRFRKFFVEPHSFRGSFLFFFLLWAFGQKKYFRKKICMIENFHSACPKKFFREKSSSLIRSFVHKCFPTLRHMFSEIWQTFVRHAVKLALQNSRRFWWRETRSFRKKNNCITVFGFWARDFWTFREHFWQGCQNWFIHVDRNFVWK